MTALNLAQIAPGFNDPTMDSQAVFRASLTALSRPGLIQTIAQTPPMPAPGHAAAAALLLTLLDPDTALWFAPSLRTSACADYLRFHTGCQFTTDPQAADFAWSASLGELPPLDQFKLGSEEYPDQSTTLVLQVSELHNAAGCWHSGPGVKKDAALRLYAGSAQDAGCATLFQQRHALQSLFPRGLDIFFAQGQRLAALPRSTRIAFEPPAQEAACT